MAVAMMVDNAWGSQEIYEQIRAHLGLDKALELDGPRPPREFWPVHNAMR